MTWLLILHIRGVIGHGKLHPLLVGFVMALLDPAAFPTKLPRAVPLLALAGVLVGFGTRLGGGCTSGHGICGNSRPVTFIATGASAVLALGGL